MAAKSTKQCPLCGEDTLEGEDYGPTGEQHLHCPECGEVFYKEGEDLVHLPGS